MFFAEDARKVARIAAGNRSALSALYGNAVNTVGAGPVGLTETKAGEGGFGFTSALDRGALNSNGGGGGGDGGGGGGRDVDDAEGGCVWQQDKGQAAQSQLLTMLPSGVLASMSERASGLGLISPGAAAASAAGSGTGVGAAARAEESAEVGSGRCCSPHHATHLEPLFPKLHSIL